ncbi:MAG: PA14 domain-containing protein [Planctomycetota bacterium]|jgi:hypothetical protein
MFSKSVCAISVVLMLCLTGSASAELIGYWKLDENSGANTVDSSGYGNEGIINGATWTSGKSGAALSFDGIDDYVSCAEREGSGPGTYPAELMPEKFTVSCWTKLNNFAYFSSFVGNGMDTGDDECGFFLYNWGWEGENEQDFGLAIRTESGMYYIETPNIYETDKWYHLAATYDGANVIIYVDGKVSVGPTDVGGPIRWVSATSDNYPERFAIGVWLDPGYDLWIDGIIDEVSYYDEALAEAEIKKLALSYKASEPSPADGAKHPETWVNLGWIPGALAASHNVYFGKNFDDVNDDAGDTFRGNYTDVFYIAGFFGYAYPDGLVPGTTYYWRIDEINEAEPNSPWKGDVWSFMVPAKTAYYPVPADGARFIDADVQLSWTSGFGTKLHTVYFGDNFDDVNNADGGTSQGTNTYTPGTLELNKTYYWRVDESDGVEMHKGHVWHFTTAGVGGGVRGDYFRGMNFENHILSRIDSQIRFSWGEIEPAPSVGVDNFSVRWTGEIEAAFAETYTFYTNSDDGIRLWVDGRLIINNWTDHGITENRGKINLVAGQTYGFVLEYYESTGSAIVDLSWESLRTPKQIIPQAALSLPLKARNARPANGAVNVKQTAIFKWGAGEAAATHNIYFGLNEQAVKNADTSSPEYKGSVGLGSESYEPGRLEWGTEYFWRIDEVNNLNPDSPWTGNVWNFTTADYLVIDDFEDYDAGENQIWYAWLDGLGYGTPDTEPYSPGNGTGSAVGDETTSSYTEETIIHGGRQAMPLFYNNDQQFSAKYSEVEMALVYPRDWTENGVGILTIWFRGEPDNAAEPLYVAINGNVVVVHDNPDAALVDEWTQWNIDLQVFADKGIDLTNVDKIAIGLGTRGNTTTPGGLGKMYFDDIGLHLSESAP